MSFGNDYSERLLLVYGIRVRRRHSVVKATRCHGDRQPITSFDGNTNALIGQRVLTRLLKWHIRGFTPPFERESVGALVHDHTIRNCS